MAIKRYKPTSNGVRNMTVVKYKDYLTTDKPYKPLVKGKKNQKIYCCWWIVKLKFIYQLNIGGWE